MEDITKNDIRDEILGSLCPFCATTPQIEKVVVSYGDKIGYEIYCRNIECCSNRQRLFNRPSDAVNNWNKRIIN